MTLPLRSAFFTLLLLSQPAAALVIRAYNSAIHDRFFGFPAGPVMNPGFLYDPLKFTGVGWNSSQAFKHFTLVSPQHFVAAQHFLPAIGHELRFVAADGTVIGRTVTAFNNIAPDAGPGITDLTLGTLSAPLPPGVKPLPYLNLPNPADYIGRDLMIFGFVVRAGHGVVNDVAELDPDGGGTYGNNWLLEFIYSGSGTNPDDAHVEVGDSGSPTFAWEGGQPALVGIHFYVNTVGDDIFNVDTFIPPYVPKLDLVLAPSGYRMRPAIFTPTTLTFTPTYTPATVFHIGESASLNLALKNTGADLTGNFAVTLTFPAAQAPATITAAGCVVDSVSSGVWSIRKATVAAAEDISITASWTSVPNLTQITGTALVESDATTAATYPLSIPAAQTYAQWSQGLAQPGQADDPDGDGLENLLEYAFGSDPQSGFTSFPGGEASRPRISVAAGIVTFSYPERVNANLLGLSYVPETTPDLAPGPWPLSLPVGNATTTQPFSPAVPGFVKRVITWPLDTPVKGARVRVTQAP